MHISQGSPEALVRDTSDPPRRWSDMEPPLPDDRWIKATLSVNLNACVELARRGDVIALRDSKSPDDVLHFTKMEVHAFIDGAKRGEFDHLIV